MPLSRWVGLWTALVLCMWRETAAAEKIRNVMSRSPAQNEDGSSAQMEAVLDRLASLDRSVAELKEQVNLLLKVSSDGGVLKALQDLRVVCEELGSSTHERNHVTSPTSSPEVTDSVPEKVNNCPQVPASDDFLLTAVMKTETDTAYIITVCYVGPEVPKISQQLQRNGKMEPLEPSDVGIVMTRRNKTDSGDPPYLSFGFEFIERSHIYVVLQLDERSPDVFFPKIQLKVEPENQKLYYPGSDVDFTIHYINGMKTPESRGHGYDMAQLYLMSMFEDNTLYSYPMLPGHALPEEVSDIQFSELSSTENSTTKLLHIPYSPTRDRGLLTMQMVFFVDCGEGCLVEYFSLSHIAVFYPDGDSKPFPDNFVGFVKERRPPDVPEPEDSGVVQCYEENERRNCLLLCRAFGDDPTVNLARADPSLPISDYTMGGSDESAFVAMKYMEILNPVFQDAGDYICSATSRDGRQVISRKITVRVHRVAKILRNMTRINVNAFANEPLMAECVAEGFPTPNVTFGPYFGSNSTDVIEEADITTIQLNDTMTQATLVLSDWREYDRNELNNIYCFASITYQTHGADDYQHIDVLSEIE